MQTVKLDNIVLKGKVYDVALGRSQETIGSLSDHKQCRLGQWFASDQSRQHPINASLKAFDKPHLDLHLHGIKAMDALKNDNVTILNKLFLI